MFKELSKSEVTWYSNIVIYDESSFKVIFINIKEIYRKTICLWHIPFLNSSIGEKKVFGRFAIFFRCVFAGYGEK